MNLVQDSANEVSDYPCSNNVLDSKSEEASTTKLLEAIESLKSDVSNLKQEVRAQRVGNNDNAKVNNFHVSTKPKTLGQQRKKEAKTDGCSHCFPLFF